MLDWCTYKIITKFRRHHPTPLDEGATGEWNDMTDPNSDPNPVPDALRREDPKHPYAIHTYTPMTTDDVEGFFNKILLRVQDLEASRAIAAEVARREAALRNMLRATQETLVWNEEAYRKSSARAEKAEARCRELEAAAKAAEAARMDSHDALEAMTGGESVAEVVEERAMWKAEAQRLERIVANYEERARRGEGKS